MSLRLGTRGSALALAQSSLVAEAITRSTGRSVELVIITSAGDVSRASLAEIGGTGVFATALREALAAGECDLLVHSLKDLPTAPAPGLTIAAVPPRADARDVVVTADGIHLADLDAGTVVGTGSPRRVAQLSGRNPRIEVRDLRGNIDSRLSRVREGELDAVVLAAAGLARLPDAVGDLQLEFMGLAEWPTAPGQGALAVEIRDGDAETARAVAALDDAGTRIAVEAERAVLAELEAGCHAPVGAHASLTGDLLRVRAVVYETGGGRRIGADRTVVFEGGYADQAAGVDAAAGADALVRAAAVGSSVARRLLERGAAELVEESSAE